MSVFPELYTTGSRVWIKHTEEVWRCASIKSNYKQTDKKLIVEDDYGEEHTISVPSTLELPPLRNPDILIGANDLTSLSYLHEPAVLYNLRVRFLEQSAIYTWCGIVLVAINPFTDLEIYGEETIQTYHKSQGNAQLDPHIYAVSEDAYSKLERDNTNQSIIVSGESGAGKTVSAKFAMRYFASIAGSQTSNIENRVLASNPIMEAIGNAKTTRNDNSSRFGKYIQILFDPQSRAITGGNMRTYLLEKSRVSRQNEGERNFHIFYQICTYAQQNKMTHLKLDSKFTFAYLGRIVPTQYDDISRFIEAMQCLGFNDKQQNLIFRIVAAVLHGGNIDFIRAENEENCVISNKSDVHLKAFCELLGLDETATRQWLTHRLLKTGMREVITTSLNAEMAQYGRDGLIKFIYEKMFLWIVTLINKALGPLNPTLNLQFIGVLDIYGFEHFETNSFEQFCINYANEVLQQQFNQHVFKLEQEEYIREGIDWQFITFTDNQPVIDLIEMKPIGILNLLDEECKMPKGTDETWGAKLYQQLTIGEVFQKPKFGYKTTFIIQHFADKVIYTVEGFLEKNRDTIWEEQIDLVKRSTIIDCIFSEDMSNEPSQKSGGKMKIAPQQQQKQHKQAKATVGSQFRESLADLMRTLNTTEPHYVRCIKPNDEKLAFEFDSIRAVQQLRACGVLETIRISSNGFPSRWSYQDFANRYRVLKVGIYRKTGKKSGSVPKPAPRKLVRAGSSTATEIRGLCEEIVKIVYEQQVFAQFKLPTEQQQEQQLKSLYQFGKTKIFFRAGQVALLERVRAQKLRECAVLLQRMIRGWTVRRRYVKIRIAIMRLQCYARSYLARKLYLHLRQTKAATIIQTKWRSWNARTKYVKLKNSVINIQRYGRGIIARRQFMDKKRNLAAIVLQKHWRGYLSRKLYKRKLKQIIIVQSLVRRWLAKRELKKLKIEARSVEHVTTLNRGLERKIIELQQKIEDLNIDLKNLRHFEAEINDHKRDTSKIDIELKNTRNELKRRDAELEAIREEFVLIQNKNAAFEKEIETHKSLITQLKSSNAEIKEQCDPKLIEDAVAEREKSLVTQFEKEKKLLIEERENERASRQQLLRKYMELEEKVQSGRGEDEEERSYDMSSVTFMMRCSELEQECAKCKHENQQLRELLANSIDKDSNDFAAGMLAQQCANMQTELDRNREERSHLKTIVLSQESSNIREPSAENELISAFKAIIKQLENENDESRDTIQQLKNEMTKLKTDNNRQQQLIGINSAAILAKGGDEMITKIGQENTLLRENCDKLTNENKQLKMELMRRNILENGTDDTVNVTHEQSQNIHFIGMFEYRQQNEQLILKILIKDLEPNAALKFQPHLPSYILFMCIRYTDYNNDDALVRTLLNNTVISIKQTVKKKQNIETFVLWLSNTCKLITLLKQYSGDEMFGDFEESLKNFDLSEYRQIYCDIAIWIYQGVIKISEERIQSMIVPAILEHEGLASSGMYSQRAIQRSGSVSGQDQDNLSPSPTEKPIEALIKELSYLHRILLLHVIEPEIIHQIFRQLFYFICAGSLNNLLLRKDLCHWNKAMQIRFNLSSLEQWCREQQIPKWSEVVEKLEPIIQATKLLQTRKSEEHIQTIVEMCNKLSSSQIMKILNLYTAGDEERIASTFIKKVQQHLSVQRKTEGSNVTLLMDTKYAFAFTIPYNPSDVKLQSINLPPVLVKKGLATVLKKL